MHYLIKECPQNLKDMSNIDVTIRQQQNRKYIYIKPSYFYIGLSFLKRNHKPQYYPMYPNTPHVPQYSPCTPILLIVPPIFPYHSRHAPLYSPQ